jgi:cystinosin
VRPFTSLLSQALGIPLGIAFPPNDPNYPDPWRRISGVIGWVYWSAWSVSFWPQVLVNFRRKSVEGLSFEYPTLNLLGFSCYTAYNAALYWNTGVRAEYAAANNGATPSVQSNDVFFAIHAVILTIVVLVQLCIYERGSQRLAWWCIIAIGCFLVAIVIVGLCTVWHASEWFSWLNFLIFLSYVKVAVTLIKYTPQAILNWRRQSTVGWSIDNILLDFTGGSLSLAQTLMDNGIKGQWGEIMGGNPAKFFLGFTSMVFDIVFMIQHYGLYRSNNARIEAEEAERAGGYTVLLGAAAGKARGPAAINGWVEE